MSASAASGNTAFQQYAAWYDAFNVVKDYRAETEYVLRLVESIRPAPRTWLDVGCGTGRHAALLLERGIDVVGVDASAAMVDQARALHPRIDFHRGTAQDFRLNDRFNVVSMLFHVLSYQTSDEAVERALSNAASHLTQDGMIVFDFWHTGGVIEDPPGVRQRTADVNGRRLFRIARPEEDRAARLVTIAYEFRWDAEDGPLAGSETHTMRHFSERELGDFLSGAGLKSVTSTGWMDDAPLAGDDWYGVICARRANA